jgi:hypothetical protein
MLVENRLLQSLDEAVGPRVPRLRSRVADPELVKFLDRHGWRYFAGRNWTRRHWRWLPSQHFELPALPPRIETRWDGCGASAG